MSVVWKCWYCAISPVVCFICYIFIRIPNYFCWPQCASCTVGYLVVLIRFIFTKIKKLFCYWGNYFILLASSAKQLAQFHYFIGLNCQSVLQSKVFSKQLVFQKLYHVDFRCQGFSSCFISGISLNGLFNFSLEYLKTFQENSFTKNILCPRCFVTRLLLEDTFLKLKRKNQSNKKNGKNSFDLHFSVSASPRLLLIISEFYQWNYCSLYYVKILVVIGKLFYFVS